MTLDVYFSPGAILKISFPADGEDNQAN